MALKQKSPKAVPQVTEQQLKRDQLKRMLIKAHKFAEQNSADINNGSIQVNLRAVIEKLGGMQSASSPREAARQSAQSASRVITHTVSQAQKKTTRTEGKVAPNASKSISQLKATAKNYGIDTKGMEIEEILGSIEWHEKGKADERKATLNHKERLRKKGIKVADQIVSSEEE